MQLYGGKAEIWRIGDKQTDKLVIPQEFKPQICEVKKYCTLPELEILLILSEKKMKEYDKVKSNKHPKQFAKDNIVYHKMRYNNTVKFYEEYYGKDADKLVAAIREYRQKNHSHEIDEHYLAELLADE